MSVDVLVCMQTERAIGLIFGRLGFLLFVHSSSVLIELLGLVSELARVK